MRAPCLELREAFLSNAHVLLLKLERRICLQPLPVAAYGAEARPADTSVAVMAAPLAFPEAVALCGREHRPWRKKRAGRPLEYKMFSAAAEGCLMCVRYYVEGVGLPHDATSETSKYTALDFAQWASAQGGTDTQAVQRYLTSFARTGVRDAVDVHSAQGLVPVAFQTSLDESGQQMAAGGWVKVDYVTPFQHESNVIENHGDAGRAWPRSPSRSPPRQPASTLRGHSGTFRFSRIEVVDTRTRAPRRPSVRCGRRPSGPPSKWPDGWASEAPSC